jgi:hypothetical protein
MSISRAVALVFPEIALSDRLGQIAFDLALVDEVVQKGRDAGEVVLDRGRASIALLSEKTDIIPDSLFTDPGDIADAEIVEMPQKGAQD